MIENPLPVIAISLATRRRIERAAAAFVRRMLRLRMRDWLALACDDAQSVIVRPMVRHDARGEATRVTFMVEAPGVPWDAHKPLFQLRDVHNAHHALKLGAYPEHASMLLRRRCGT